MEKKYILAIDQSTSGTKAALVNTKGEIEYKESMTHKQIYPQTGWVEHNPLEIYENVKTLIYRMIKNTSSSAVEVLSITNQRETVVVWDKETHLPIYNAIVWQCRRTVGICESLSAYETIVHEKTGLSIDPYFSATKIKWILDNIEGAKTKAREGKLLFGTIDSWLIWKLTNGKMHVTDYSNASRTLLFNIHTLQWDQELLTIFEIPASMVPSVKDSTDHFGIIADEYLSINIPITGVIGDSQGALFGQKCFKPSMVKATYGTGTSVMMHTGEYVKANNGLVASIAWGINGNVEYVLEGIINSTGDVIKWLIEDMEYMPNVALVEELAASLADNEGVYFVPAFVGLGTPYWNPNARAAIVGMSRNTGKAHIARAALECIAYQVRDVVDLMKSTAGMEIEELYVDGGATNNQFLMQFQANLLNLKVTVSTVSELSLMGSVYLAGLASGVWSSVDEIKDLYQEASVYEGNIANDLRDKYYAGWKTAVKQVLI